MEKARRLNPLKKEFEHRVSRMVEQLADSPLRNFWISLDSAVDHVHETMRGFPGVVAGIAKALPIFHRAGIYPAVNLGINRNVGGDATRWLHRKDFGSDNAVQGTDRSHSTVPIQNSDLFTPVFTGGPDPPLDADACRQCDWECFRDPSEMFGPLLYLFANPLGLIRRMASRPGSLATWAGDLSYYRACGFFNGRRPPDFQKLNRFSFSAIKAGSAQPSAINCRRFNQKLSVS